MAKPLRRSTRKTLWINERDVQRLQKILGTSNASEAVRRAVEDRLFAEEVLTADNRIIRRGGLADVYHRAKPVSRKA